MYKKRHLETQLRRMAQFFKIIIITGARQVGKTTLLQHVFPLAKIITFDPEEDVLQARNDPAFFFKNQPKPLILDEIQYAPELLPVLKRLVDQDDSYGQYFLTGSHNLNILKSISESLAGRVGILDLSSMTTYEQTEMLVPPLEKARSTNLMISDALTNNEELPATSLWIEHYLRDAQTLPQKIVGTTQQSAITAVWRGGMPGTLHFPDDMMSRYFSSYVQTYLQRDVCSLAEVNNITSFQQFVRLISALTGQEINSAQLGREADIDPRTVRSWLAILNHSYLWHELLPYSNNTIKRVVSSKVKGFLGDTGLACFLLKISDQNGLLAHPARGALFETLVINTIRTLLHTIGDVADMYYWRTRNGAEVDLVLLHNGALYPIEIKMKIALASKDGSGLRSFRETYEGNMPVKTGLIIYAGEECRWFDKNTIVLPWNAVCA